MNKGLTAVAWIGILAWGVACSSGNHAGNAAAGAGGQDAATETSGGSGGVGRDAGPDALNEASSDGAPDGGGAGGSAGGNAGEAGPGAPADPTTIAVVSTTTDAGMPAARLLVAGTDFSTTTEVSSVDPTAGSVAGHSTVADGDAVPAASGGLGFILERTRDQVDVLASDGSIAQSIDVTALGDANPPSSIAHEAFVTLYDANRVAVIDLDAARVAYSIDLTSYLDPNDSDGSVDVDNAVYDPARDRVYVTLARIDLNTITTPNYELACPSEGGLLLAIDATTLTPVDLNGSAPGVAVQLSLVDPVSVALDAANHRLLVMDAGCFASADGGAQRVKHGIEAVDLSTGATSVPYQPSTADFLTRLILTGAGQALVDRFDASYVEHWNWWQVGASTLGSELSGVPDAVSYDGADALLGVSFPAPEAGGGPDVVSYDLGTETTTTIVSSPWSGTFSSAAGSALVE
jgi:hypothetical protein